MKIFPSKQYKHHWREVHGGCGCGCFQNVKRLFSYRVIKNLMLNLKNNEKFFVYGLILQKGAKNKKTF